MRKSPSARAPAPPPYHHEPDADPAAAARALAVWYAAAKAAVGDLFLAAQTAEAWANDPAHPAHGLLDPARVREFVRAIEQADSAIIGVEPRQVRGPNPLAVLDEYDAGRRRAAG